MAFDVENFPEFGQCNCEECECADEITPPFFIKVAGNIVSVALFFHILLYRVGVVFTQRKQIMILGNQIREAIGKFQIVTKL